MFDTMLESNSRRERSAGGTIASVGAHTALITAAVLATAQARVQPRITPELMHTVYFPPRAVDVPAKSPDGSRGNTVRPPAIPLIDTRRIDIDAPRIDLSTAPAAPIDFSPRPGEPRGGEGEPVPAAGGVSDANRVEKQAALMAGSATP